VTRQKDRFCYLVRCADGSLYVGIATDLEERLREHNAGEGARYTARRKPVELVWSEHNTSRAAARSREAQIKRWSRAKKEALVGGFPRLRSGQANPSAPVNSPQRIYAECSREVGQWRAK